MILPRILNNVLDKRLDPIRIQLRFVVQQQLEADRFIDSKEIVHFVNYFTTLILWLSSEVTL